MKSAAATRYEIMPSSCWQWTGKCNPFGYGRIYYKGKEQAAHRVLYEMHRGPIPDGLVLDHLCRNPSCVNPDHLEPVTNGENVLRGLSFGALNKAKTHCKKGHPFEGDNLLIRKDGRRKCRACLNQWGRESKQRARDRAKAEVVQAHRANDELQEAFMSLWLAAIELDKAEDFRQMPCQHECCAPGDWSAYQATRQSLANEINRVNELLEGLPA